MGVTILLLITLFLLFYSTPIIIGKFKTTKSSIDFTASFINSGIVIVPLKQGTKELNFMVDTGANYSYITESSLKDINFTECGETDTVVTASSISEEVRAVLLALNYKGTSVEHKFWILNMEESLNTIEESENIKIHGIIGNDFLSTYGYIIDFKNFKVYTA